MICVRIDIVYVVIDINYYLKQQSEVEETIERIKVQPGIEGYVICNKQGQVLRRYPQMTPDLAEKFSAAMISLASQARSVVRDLNPKVHRNDIRVISLFALYCFHTLERVKVSPRKDKETRSYDRIRRPVYSAGDTTLDRCK